MSTLILYGVIIMLFIASWIKDKQKTKKALKIGLNAFKKLMPSLIPIMVGIGVILAFLSPEAVSKILGENSGFMGMVLGIIIGSVAFMPGFVAFPLGATLLENGAGYPQIAGFVSSLMAVGFVSLGLEIKHFGKRAALLRNFTALLASILFVFIIWRIM